MRRMSSNNPRKRSAKSRRTIRNVLNRYVVDRAVYKSVEPITKTKIYIEETITATYVQTIRVICKRRIKQQHSANHQRPTADDAKPLLNEHILPESTSMNRVNNDDDNKDARMPKLADQHDEHLCNELNCRVLVYDNMTNTFLIGGAAPTPHNIHQWLIEHPTYEIVRYGTGLADDFFRIQDDVKINSTNCCGQDI